MKQFENLPQRLVQVITEKEKELGFTTLEVMQDKEGNAYLLAKRAVDGTYIVWSAYNTGDDLTAYTGLYSGAYDLSLEEGIAEMKRRAS